jgi:hypothetical protein
MILVIKIKTGKFTELNAISQYRIRWTRNYVHMMAKLTQGFADIADVNTLPSAGRVTPVCQQAYFERLSFLPVFSIGHAHG